ncbi:MAG: hypothetical protein IPO85_11995 [Saprospiraceae bacterium]|uniref:Uncharacterized protein n=1 Tax=Candidatus Defluviibacterium haderslevense TaxID=2981993 RepID=A0A9D7XF18_9BACT|nr:hypothetical protein [Candidatus Defluviibacterium haderslevense]
MKIWTSKEKGDDKIIIYANETIYKANPAAEKIDEYLFNLKMQNSPTTDFFSIPLRYISEINLQEGKKYIAVIFKGDYEHFKIADDKRRNEIFEFFKQNIPGANFSLVSQSKLQSVKKPLIAIGVILAIFLWTLYIALGIEDGNEYDVIGQRYHSIAGIVLALASLGVNKIVVIFGSLFLIAGLSLRNKYKNPIIKNALTIKH